LPVSAAAARVVGALAAVLALSVLAPAGADAAGFVTRSGDQLRLHGSPYRFTGFNIYNANSDGDCGPAMSTGPALDESLAAIGPGSNAFRSWFFQSLATTDGVRDWSAFDHTLAVARSRGFRVIATLTNQFGDCEAPDGYKDETWYTTGYRALDPAGIVSYRDWVAEVVNHYKDDPTILAWQLVNEAAVQSSPGAACGANAAQILKSFTTDVSGLVKSIDPNHLVSLGTIGTGQCGAEGAEYQDLHDVKTIDLCEYHDYGEPGAPMPGDEFNGLAVRIDQCDAIHKPIFVGETGIVPNDIGGTLAARAAAFDAKFAAQFGAGVVGELVWTWSTLGSRLDDFDVGAGDLTIAVVGSYAFGRSPPTGNGKNRAKACKAERAAIGTFAFREVYGTNKKGSNAFGKCVSGKDH
jgi:mannan endo-1,4-beta-mannosidase